MAEERALPPVKIHCSILAEDAIKAAVADYRSRQPGAAAVLEQPACAPGTTPAAAASAVTPTATPAA